ncbi:MAG TPA: response regulator, partial [Candidatus Polarisedimenticolia bacterium]|nr:response regulator [Candidatus Polarisedimenticolia bacterium]
MTSKSRVLIVEDDVEMRRFLEEELSEAGHEVLSAAGGAEALEQLSRSDVDVVVTDFVMPGMKGEALLSEF